MRYLDLPKRNRHTETKQKRTIKNIGKMHLVNAGTKWITYFPKYIIHKNTYSIKSAVNDKSLM